MQLQAGRVLALLLLAAPEPTRSEVITRVTPADDLNTVLNALGPGAVLVLVAGNTSQIPCPIGTYADGPERCTECPSGTTTLNTSTPSAEGCVCRAGFYDGSEPNATTGIECTECPPSDEAECQLAGAGVTLESMPLAEGVWRSHDRSPLLHKCLDASLCEGGRDCHRTDPGEALDDNGLCGGYCSAHHRGPFCSLCVDNCSAAEATGDVCLFPTRTRNSDGECEECDGSHLVTLPSVLLGLLVLGAIWTLCTGRGARFAKIVIGTANEDEGELAETASQ